MSRATNKKRKINRRTTQDERVLMVIRGLTETEKLELAKKLQKERSK